MPVRGIKFPHLAPGDGARLREQERGPLPLFSGMRGGFLRQASLTPRSQSPPFAVARRSGRRTAPSFSGSSLTASSRNFAHAFDVLVPGDPSRADAKHQGHVAPRSFRSSPMPARIFALRRLDRYRACRTRHEHAFVERRGGFGRRLRRVRLSEQRFGLLGSEATGDVPRRS